MLKRKKKNVCLKLNKYEHICIHIIIFMCMFMRLKCSIWQKPWKVKCFRYAFKSVISWTARSQKFLIQVMHKWQIINGESVWLNSDNTILMIHTTSIAYWLSMWIWLLFFFFFCLIRNVLILGLVTDWSNPRASVASENM